MSTKDRTNIYYTGFIFKNIQTWVNNTLTLYKGLNVIEAKSETGKSVFVKCLTFATNYKKIEPERRETIVRNFDPNQPGQFAISLSNGDIVVATFTTNSLNCIVRHADGSIHNCHGPFDQYTLDLLGLRTVKGSDRILNILDNENPIVFDNTESTYNNDIMNIYIQPPDLVNLRNFLMECEKNIKESRGHIEQALKSVATQMEYYADYGDLSLVEDYLVELSKLDTELTAYESYIEALNNLGVVYFQKSLDEDKMIDLNNSMISLEHTLRFVQTLDSLEETLVSSTSSSKGLPDEVFISLESQLNALQHQYEFLLILYRVYVLSKERIPNLEESTISTLDTSFNQLKITQKYAETLDVYMNDTSDIPPILDEVSLVNLHSMKRQTEFYLLLLSYIDTHYQNLLNYEEQTQKVLRSESELQEYIMDHPTCPTCGQLIEGGILHEH